MVATFPEQRDLYPDVANKGSLAAALQEAAVGQGLSLGGVAELRQQLQAASVPSTMPQRDPLIVRAAPAERRLDVVGWGQGIHLVSGGTPDLAEVARAAHGWQRGVALRDIQRSAPFVSRTYLAEAAELGPEHVVAAQWQRLREHAHTVGWPSHRALVEAAYAEPKLRQLFPYTSHWSLRFSTSTGYPFSPDVVSLQASQRDGSFTVRSSWMGAILGATATSEEAVKLAVRHVPASLGPAVAGPYRNRRP